ncbi:hypothetical protein ACS0TY_001267 [Phlomoides rotata]
MNNIVHVPPGFRFHPTDEELVDYYLRRKVTSRRIDVDVIKDVDLYRIEPWDLQELCRIGREEQNEWYFFSHKDKKYPTGSRTNRATAAGFWKATGRDKSIYSKQNELIGMRKTLVFYKGRAPNGFKSHWIMHEYRLETDENGTSQEEGWVVCRVFKKRIGAATSSSSTHRLNVSPPIWYEEMNYSCKKEMDYGLIDHHFLQLPNLESPSLSYGPGLNTTDFQPSGPSQQPDQDQLVFRKMDGDDHLQVTDWRVLDKFVASQLSHDQGIIISEESNDLIFTKQKPAPENGSTSISSCYIDLWE